MKIYQKIKMVSKEQNKKSNNARALSSGYDYGKTREFTEEERQIVGQAYADVDKLISGEKRIDAAYSNTKKLLNAMNVNIKKGNYEVVGKINEALRREGPLAMKRLSPQDKLKIPERVYGLWTEMEHKGVPKEEKKVFIDTGNTYRFLAEESGCHVKPYQEKFWNMLKSGVDKEIPLVDLKLRA